MIWLDVLVQGILLGGLYALFAAGLSLVFGIMRLVNLAHGDLIVFAAFAVIAGMAIVISTGAGLMLGRLGGTMGDLSGKDIPRLAASLQLSAQSASLASQGPALLAARSEGAPS